MPLPFLTDDEILTMAHPLRQPAAIRRWCKDQSIPHKIKPSGMPLISRNFADQNNIQSANDSQQQQPDALSLIAKFRKEAKNGNHGTKEKKQSTQPA